MPRGGVCAPGGDQEEGPSSGTGTSGRDAPSSRRWGGRSGAPGRGPWDLFDRSVSQPLRTRLTNNSNRVRSRGPCYCIRTALVETFKLPELAFFQEPLIS